MTEKHIKPPMLSTSFSQNAESAKRRFANILSMRSKKRGAAAALTAVLLTAAVCAFVACGNGNIGIIGGADGPTSIYVSQKTDKNKVHDLYNLKNTYIGDNSRVSQIIDSLPFTEGLIRDHFELQTSSKPYSATVFYNAGTSQPDIHMFKYNAAVMFALIDNADSVAFSVFNSYFPYTRQSTAAYFEQPFSYYTESEEHFNEFISLIAEMGTSEKLANAYDKTNIEECVSQAVFISNYGSYMGGECRGEGHETLNINEENNIINVYALTTYGEYNFENGDFIKSSGSGVIPAVFRFTKNAAGEYNLISAEYPMDGSEWLPSVKKMFPENLHSRIISSVSDETVYKRLKNQEHRYAEEYLKSINRTAKIGDYSDFPHTPIGIDVSSIEELQKYTFSYYPYNVGTKERIENGIRYVYETSWSASGGENGTLIYHKYEYDSGNTIEKAVINVENGEIKFLERVPDAKKED